MIKSFAQRHALGGLLSLLLVCLPALVRADEVPATPLAAEPPAVAPLSVESGVAKRQALETAIEEQKSRRSGAIAGFAIGGAVVIGGLIAAAVKAQQEADDRARNSGDGRGSATEFNWIGLAVGLPILGISAYVFSDAQKQLNRLRLQRTHLTLAPEQRGGMRVGLSVDF